MSRLVQTSLRLPPWYRQYTAATRDGPRDDSCSGNSPSLCAEPCADSWAVMRSAAAPLLRSVACLCREWCAHQPWPPQLQQCRSKTEGRECADDGDGLPAVQVSPRVQIANGATSCDQYDHLHKKWANHLERRCIAAQMVGHVVIEHTSKEWSKVVLKPSDLTLHC